MYVTLVSAPWRRVCSYISQQVYLTDRWTSLKCIYLLCRYLPITLWPYILWCFVPDHPQEECTEKVIVLQHMVFTLMVTLLPSIHCAILMSSSSYSSPTVGHSFLHKADDSELSLKNRRCPCTACVCVHRTEKKGSAPFDLLAGLLSRGPAVGVF